MFLFKKLVKLQYHEIGDHEGRRNDYLPNGLKFYNIAIKALEYFF